MWKAEFGSSLQALHAFNAYGRGGYFFGQVDYLVERGKRENVVQNCQKGEREGGLRGRLKRGGPLA